MVRWWTSWLLVSALATAQPPAAVHGPRVTIQALQQPTWEVLDAVGRQLNRLFTGTVVQSKARTRPIDLELDEATVAETLEAVARATGGRVTRSSRFVYRVDEGRPAIGEIGEPLGDFQCWLRYVRYTYYSYYYPAEPAKVTRLAYLSPYIAIEAPSDPEALRLAGVSAPAARTDTGDELLATARRSRTIAPYDNDPRLWLLSDLLATAGLHLTSLRSLWFDVTFARELAAMRFDFRLADGAGQLQSDGDYDARLEPPEEGQDWSAGAAVNLQRALGLDPEQPTGPERVWVEGRFFDADDRPLYTLATAEAPIRDEALWQNRWSFRLYRLDEKVKPVRLEVLLYVPLGTGVTERVTFEHVPLPARSDDPPPPL